MTPFAMHSAFEQTKHPIPAHLRGTAMTAGFSVVEQAPWVYSALSDLWDLEQAGRNVRALGDLRIEVNTVIRARKLLSRIGGIPDLPVPVVNVFSGGGLTLTWELGPREVKYTFWPEGVLTFWREREGQAGTGDQLADDNTFDPRGPIEWLLRP